ncbi:MAG: UbiD family decarboxylase [Nitrospinota bacterium]
MKDLRTFIEDLEEKSPGQLLRVKRPVSPHFEIPAVVRRLQEERRFPAILFEQVEGRAHPVITNVHACRDRVALALGVSDQREMLSIWSERLEKPIPWASAETGPVKEVIQRGEGCDLRQLPIITHAEMDSGPFITGGVLVVRNPDTGIPNVGIYRHMLKGPRRLGCFINEGTHLFHLLKKAEAKGKDLECVIFIGHHPLCVLASQVRGPLQDELATMGGVLGESLELVQAETVDLPVPARAEIAIEGRILCGVREEEGPFGEYTFFYGEARNSPVIEVTAITRRRDAIYYDVYSPYIDHVNCAILAQDAYVFNKIRTSVPNVLDVYHPSEGVIHTAIIQIRKETEGQGKAAGLAALASVYLLKIAIIVDEDVNPRNLGEVLWAITTRTRPDRDFDFIKDVHCGTLDALGVSGRGWPHKNGLNTKVIIDATKPIDVPLPARCDPPEDLWRALDLADYFPGWNSPSA